MASAPPASLVEEIARLRRERNAVVLAHNYQEGEVQDIADFTGDSLALARRAAETPARVIVFCGVHFMAETAAILCPEKTVLLPDLEAGCSLAATITAEELRAWKADHPGAVVVTYVNSSAAVKAESDYCCTSSNAVKVVESIPADQEILFAPDMYLGRFVREKTGRRIHLWPGSCHVHYKIPDDDIVRMKREHPGAEVLVHPECGCLSAALRLADHVASTSGMIRRAKESPAKKFIVATETGILHAMRRQNPEKTFIPIREDAVCEFMKKITLEKVLWSLEEMRYKITVPPDVAARAKRAIDRMVAIPGA
ncbi:MAG: quinolinate synthase NadA [Elusimicrobiota bacterium]